jgi:putative SbcD/Mre11-related phosphoesterase
MKPRFITNEPALMMGDTLVIADLHIGIDYEYRKSGIKIPSYLQRVFPELEKLIRENNARKLMILGDLRHRIPQASWQEIKELPEFFRYFQKLVDIEICPGNHDAQIEDNVLSTVKLYPRSGVLIGDVYYMHGHAWPDPGFLKAKYLIMGHVHPGIEFRSELGYRWVESIWMRAELDPKRITEKYGPAAEGMRLPEVIVLPMFNYYTGTVAMNKPFSDVEKSYSESPGPIMKSIKLPHARAYLLDGTYLGKIGKIRTSRRYCFK